MTDRELLELAAKAAGLTVRWHDSGHYGPTMEIMEDEAGGPPWNPLTDDGDALRLAVKLGLLVDTKEATSRGYQSTASDGSTDWQAELHISDPYEATRRAIVRAAAEIGKGIK